MWGIAVDVLTISVAIIVISGQHKQDNSVMKPIFFFFVLCPSYLATRKNCHTNRKKIIWKKKPEKIEEWREKCSCHQQGTTTNSITFIRHTCYWACLVVFIALCIYIACHDIYFLCVFFFCSSTLSIWFTICVLYAYGMDGGGRRIKTHHQIKFMWVRFYCGWCLFRWVRWSLKNNWRK